MTTSYGRAHSQALTEGGGEWDRGGVLLPPRAIRGRTRLSSGLIDKVKELKKYAYFGR